MIATATTSDSHEHRLGIPASKAFDEIVFNDPTVCSRCFSVIRKRDTYRPDVGIGGVSRHAPEERLRRAYDGERGYRCEDMDEYGEIRVYHPCTYCGECGSQHGRADNGDLSEALACEFAGNAADRLRESSMTVSRDALQYAVGKFKRMSEIQGYDTEIFRRATKIAIRRARRYHDS